MKRKLGIVALLALLLALLSAGIALAEGVEDKIPFGESPVPRWVQKKVLSKAATEGAHLDLNKGFRPFQQNNARDMAYGFQITQPSLITIEMRVARSQRGPWLYFSDSLEDDYVFSGAPDYTGRKWPHTYRISAYVKVPGVYYAGVIVDKLGRTFELRVSARTVTGLSPAGDGETIVDYVPGTKVRGLIGPQRGEEEKSTDIFWLHLDTATRFNLTFKSTGNLIDFRILQIKSEENDEDLELCVNINQDNSRRYSRGKTYKTEVNLPDGEYYLVVGKVPEEEHEYKFYNGLYELTLSRKGAARTTVAVESETVTEKFQKQLNAFVSPGYFQDFDPGSVRFTPVKNRNGTVTADGIFTGIRPGSLNVTVSGMVNGVPKTGKVKLKVAKNEFVKNPKPEKEYGSIVASVKRKYFKGNYFCVDMWIHNGIPGVRITRIADIDATLTDLETNEPLGYYRPSGSIRKTIRYNKAGVITLKFPKRDMDTVYDLREGGAELLGISFDYTPYGY